VYQSFEFGGKIQQVVGNGICCIKQCELGFITPTRILKDFKPEQLLWAGLLYSLTSRGSLVDGNLPVCIQHVSAATLNAKDR